MRRKIIDCRIFYYNLCFLERVRGNFVLGNILFRWWISRWSDYFFGVFKIWFFLILIVCRLCLNGNEI